MLVPILHLAVAASAATPTSSLTVDLEGLRSAKGVIQACLTQNRKSFPDCRADPHALKATVAANARQLVFTEVPAGNYALTLFHDENANGKLDTLLGVPREGFGFSRNPVVRFGPPRYDNVSMNLGPGFTRIRVRLQYML